MTRSRRTLVTLALAAGLVQAGSAQQDQQAAQPRPTFRTDINFVRVDVIVTDKGQPVTDLTQADFELREDGKPQSIEQFRLVKVDGRPRPGDPPPREIRNRDDEEVEAARDDTRVIAIFLDDYHTRLGSALSVKKSLIDFIQKQVRPTDMLAVMYPLTPVTALQFTRNHESIISAINSFEGRKFRYDARNDFERQYERQPTEVVEQMRNQVSMSALRGLATRLGSIREGRKAVIYVSEGFTALLPPQMRNSDASQPCLSPLQPGCSSAIGSPSVGENDGREDTARAFATSDIMLRLRDVYADFNRNNTSIYALDPRGLATNEFGIDDNIGPNQDAASLRLTQDTLRVLAEQTDGKAVVARNDLARGLEQMMQDSSYYYLLGYTSAVPTDGKFHELKINVKRRGVEVRGRRGFWAATAEDLTRATTPAPTLAKPIETALAALSTPAQAMQYVRTWVGTERGENGKTRVTLVWEPVAGPAGARREQPGRVSVIAATAAGDLVYRGRSPEQLTASAAAAPTASAAPTPMPPQRVTFEAPPGPMELRLSVEGAAGGVLDNDIKKITVPDLTTPQVAISTPRVFRARTARDFQALSRDAAAVPATGREFSRTDRLLIRFDAYAAGTEMPAVTAVLMNRSGQKMADVPVAAATAGGTHQIDLGLASIPPAEYLVEITVKSSSGETKELVPLRVVS
jgi:VWFA-related protein